MTEHNLFMEFPTTTKAEWLSKIEKDLKGRAISELTWNIPHISIDSFGHADDFEENYAPISEKLGNNWQICENIEVLDGDFKRANQKALNALMGGANSLNFIFETFPSESQLLSLLENIELIYISIYFNEQSQNTSPLAFLKSFKSIVEKRSENATVLRGGVVYDPFADGRHDVKATIDLLNWASENLPEFKVVAIDAVVFFKRSEEAVEELINTLKSANTYFQKLEERGFNIALLSKKAFFKVDIGISYFIEIAKLRVLKLLWGNLLEAYQIPVHEPMIWAHISEATQVEDVNTNKIRATTQAMSAVIGSVEMVSIAPSDAISGQNIELNVRIARNIQHLLQMESYLDKVADPSAGSYYIEKLTNQIAEAVWQQFQEEI